MSYIETLGKQVGTDIASGAAAGIGGSLGEQLSYGIGQLTGYNKELRKQHLKQSQALTDMQGEANKNLMSYGQELQKEMFDYTSPNKRVQQLKEAGLNPALMYGMGGQGGSTLGTPTAPSATMGHASDESSMRMANIQSAGMGLQLSRLKSEIEVNKSIAEKNRADAGLTSGAMTDKTNAEIVKLMTDVNAVNQSIQVMKTDEALKGKQGELIELQKNSYIIQNKFDTENNTILLSQNASIARKLLTEASLSEESKDTILATLKANLGNVLKDTLLKESNKRLNDKEIEHINAKIAEISNNIYVSKNQLYINESNMLNSWNEVVLSNKSGFISKDLRNLQNSFKKAVEAVTGKDNYVPESDLLQNNYKPIERK